MRLLGKVTILHMLITIFIFLIGGLVAYDLYHEQIKTETDWELRRSEWIATHYLGEGINYEKLVNPSLEIKPVPADSQLLDKRLFSDTLIYLKRLDKEEAHRKLSVVKAINDEWYKLTLTTVIFEEEDVIQTVSFSISLLFLILSVAIVFSNFLISRRLFQPFQRSLDAIRNFNLTQSHDLELPKEHTHEFDQLNKSLNQLIQENLKEYRLLKEFSENASHEIQTPLAIAQSKLEMLVQSPRLNGEDLELVSATLGSVEKMSRLGYALTLLTKIENREFYPKDETALQPAVCKLADGFEELIKMSSLCLRTDIESDYKVLCHPVLLDVLISNLINNAIKHNQEGGCIDIALKDNQLIIANSGKPIPFHKDLLFERFRKGQNSEKSLGLGLAIVKKICEVHHFKISYNYQDSKHFFQIIF